MIAVIVNVCIFYYQFQYVWWSEALRLAHRNSLVEEVKLFRWLQLYFKIFLDMFCLYLI